MGTFMIAKGCFFDTPYILWFSESIRHPFDASGIYFITWIYSVSHDILRYGSKICQTPRSCVVLGVPKPNVSYSIIVPLEAIKPGIYHIFVSNAKWTKQCYLHSFWSLKKHVQGPAKHARKTYRKCWRFLPLPVFNTDKQETCCFVRNGPVIRKKNET